MSHNDLEKTQNAVIFERIEISSIFILRYNDIGSKFFDSGEKISLNSKVSSRGASEDHLLYRLSILQTFFKLPCHVAYC